ncbi:MAG: RNA pseudouridine synthase [Phycisphaerales bacterium]|nr:RNA pseudouridine synthase [Phycisphaerales bacterium]MCB9854254.1 RNA pseudouridine synthase [Phycisphaerales bacterium]MCB9864738.1 RNA pseudouridine synthase [Phycisphaerales bacterium]
MNHDTPAPIRKQPKPVVLLQDDDLTIVNKPAGVWPREGIFDDPGVFDILAPDKEPDEIRFRQINPLDFEVSGAVIYANNADAEAAIREQFDSGEASLVYTAIVGGPLLADAGAIASDGNGTHESSSSSHRSTGWRILDAFVGFAVIECTSSSLVEHQIRKDLQRAGMPLAVDARYGGAKELMLSSFKAGYRKSRRRPERPLIERPSVHLSNLSLLHPTDRRELTLDIEPAKDFRALLNQLDRFARIPK